VFTKIRVQANVRIILVIAAALTVVVVSFMSLQAPASAQSNNFANTLKISPVRTDIEIEPGTSKTIQITATNITKNTITVRPIENDFVAGDERGTPALILDADKFAPTHSLKRFMSPLADVTIPAGKSQIIKLVITVPKNAQAGGYFGAVRLAPATSVDGGQVNLTGSAASLILMTVPGPVTEKLNLTDFSIQQGGKSGTTFSSPNDLQASVRFENKGGAQVAPFGKVSVKQGDEVVYEADFNNKDPRDMILPDSARRFDVPLKNIESFGNYTVSATFTYGTKNQTIEVSKSFWVIPQAVIIATIVGVLLLIGLIVGIWLFLRNYKRRVLRNHGRGGLNTRHRR
jgi:hypothetical protein